MLEIRPRVFVCLAWMLGFVLQNPLSGQQTGQRPGPVIQGTLTAQESGIPLGSGAVTLLGEPREEIRLVLADDDGRYLIQLPGPGTYRLRAQRIGYHPQEKGPFTVGATDTLTVDFQLAPSPLLLDSILVSVRRRGEQVGTGEQLVYGRLVDDESGDPIPQGLVRLLRESGSSAAATLSDDEGLFWLISPSAGTYRVQAERIGYKTSTGPEMNLMLGDTIGLEFRLSVEAVLLNPLVVTATARPMQDRYSSPGMEDFYKRYAEFGKGGFGEFLIRDSIAQFDDWPILATQMIAMEMLSVAYADISSGRVSMGGQCESPHYYLNGSIFFAFPLWSLMPFDVEAVEVYEHPFIPAAFFRPHPLTGEFPCGVVSIWTRRVPPERPHVPLFRKVLFGAGFLGVALGLALFL